MLGPLQVFKNISSMPKHRCKHSKCQAYVLPHHGHLIFKTGAGGPQTTSLQRQAAILMFAVHNSNQALTHNLTGRNHKVIEDICVANDRCRQVFVEEKEKLIAYGSAAVKEQSSSLKAPTNHPKKAPTASGLWFDVEADEVDLRADLVEGDDVPKEEAVQWEQWGGVSNEEFANR